MKYIPLFETKIPTVLNDNFWKWFGNSKIIENNKPIICYHGSDKNIKIFDNKYSSEGVFWFSDNINKIKNGESGAVSNKFIIPVYLKISKLAGWDEYEKLYFDQIEKQGFDGIKLDDNYIVFNPNQIKNIFNNGMFSQSDNIYQ